MGKKIVMAVFGGIALVGVLLGIVGFAMGGRPVNFRAENDGLYMVAGSKRHKVSNTNLQELEAAATRFGEYLEGRMGRYTEHVGDFEGDYDYDYDYDEDYEYPEDIDADAAKAAEEYSKWVDSGAEITGGLHSYTPSMPANDVREITLDIDSGYIRLQPGDELELMVEGPLTPTLREDGGKWSIESELGDNLRTRERGGSIRFYQGSRDITTRYTLTVPNEHTNLTLKSSLGIVTIDGISLGTFNLEQELGSIRIYNTSIQTGEIETELGYVELNDATADTLFLDTELGAIRMHGSIKHALTARCELGSIEATLEKPASYSWALETELGSINLAGEYHASIGGKREGGSPNADTHFDLRCNLGSIDVNWT